MLVFDQQRAGHRAAPERVSLMPLRIMISAGEASADRLGASLLTALSARTDLESMGMGGPRLGAAGLIAWRQASELSVVGLVEVVRHVPRLLRVIADLAAKTVKAAPDIAVLIDAPDFHLRLARRLRGRGFPVVLFVPPAVWASRPGRLRAYAAAFDEVWVLFPFEVAPWTRAGVRTEWIGHPLCDEIPLPVRPPDPARAPIALLPGSRAGELKRHLPVLSAAARRLLAERVADKFVVPVADPRFHEVARSAFGGLPVAFVDGAAAVRTAVGGARGALVSSGTATLETALLGCPQAVLYRLHPVTYALARRLMTVDHWALPNLLDSTPSVPECIQREATPARLVDALRRQLARGEAASIALADRARARLGPAGAAGRAAEAVLRAVSAK